jgi:hypothetical protein
MTFAGCISNRRTKAAQRGGEPRKASRLGVASEAEAAID